MKSEKRPKWRRWPCSCRESSVVPGATIGMDDCPLHGECGQHRAALADALIDIAVAMVELYMRNGAWAGCKSDPLSEKPEVYSRQWYASTARALGIL